MSEQLVCSWLIDIKIKLWINVKDTEPYIKFGDENSKNLI